MDYFWKHIVCVEILDRQKKGAELTANTVRSCSLHI